MPFRVSILANESNNSGSSSQARAARKAAQPKKTAVPRRTAPKQINCKTCGKPCVAGKRGLCDKHWAEEQQAKAKNKAKIEKIKERKAKKVEKRRESLPFKKKKLHDIFSRYIRLRDTDADGNATCIDCGTHIQWHQVQCGHFRRRELMPTTWDERNCNAQWGYCNGPLKGREYEYGVALNIKYGPGTAEELCQLSHKEANFTREELDEKIKYYQKKVEELLKTKNFTPWKK
jgi:Bacteriophage Lambda NinG protein